jgi:hypothetical protein
MFTAQRQGSRRDTLLGLAVAAILLLVPALAAAQAELTFDPPDGVFLCEDTLVVELHVDGSVDDLQGYSLVLSYDQEVVTPLAVQVGELLAGAACGNFFTWLDPGAAGTITVDAALLGCSVGGPGAILAITFGGVVDGISPLGCVEGELRDSLNASIPFDCVAASVQYSCAVPTRSAAWHELRGRYR